ncbi:MAG: iron-sulfur cluster assembly accessory protein [Phycisphaerae bacterium]|jgi:iron-sulfur cluster assembly protein
MSITLTERAAKQIQRLFTEHQLAPGTCLRVGIKGGGCSGFSYFINVASAPDGDDEVFTSRDVRIVCDPKSYLYLVGTEIDYDDSLISRGFLFNNPNAKGTCACGASFNT